MSLENQIRAIARDLLETKQVQCMIGYEIGSHGRVRPAFIYDPAEVERLVWNQACTHNLVGYLHDKNKPLKKGEVPPRVGIVVKPCDSRGINVLLAENQIQRQQIYVIGVTCEGVLEGAGFCNPQTGNLQSRCQRCTERIPVVYDALLGEAPRLEAGGDAYEDIAQLEAMSPQERLSFWMRQYDRCIRCYACRQVCPACYCSVCMFERDDSLWVGIASGLKEKEFFHLGRAYHLAGRCVGCNECERVCPMDLPISLLNRKLAKEMQELFDYRAGMKPEKAPLVTMLAEGEESLI